MERWSFIKKIAKLFLDIQIIQLLVLIFSAGIYWYQASVSRQALIVNKDQEQRQLRAYVGKIRSLLTINADAEENINLNLTFKNFGQTPAYYPHYLVAPTIQELQSDQTYDTNPSNLQITGKFGTIYSQQEYTGNLPSFSYKDNIKDKNYLKPVLVWYGVLHYQDIFGDDRTTHFCFVYPIYMVKNIEQDTARQSTLDCADSNDDYE